jgi:hypothetical protein
MNFRNVLTILGALVLLLLVLGLLSTVLTQIIPIAIALIAGFALGRVTVNRDLFAMLSGAIQSRRAVAAAPVQETTQPAQTVAKADDDSVQTEAAAIKARLSEVEAEAPEAPISDFDIKTEDEVLAQARRLEDEASKKAAEYDPTAALEERRRRLLGDQADES